MPDDDSMLGQDLIDVRNEARRRHYPRQGSVPQSLVDKARRAKHIAAAPDYDEVAIRDALWALVDATIDLHLRAENSQAKP